MTLESAADDPLVDQLQQLVAHLDAALWLTTPDKREMTYLSPAFGLVFGCEPREFRERPGRLMELVHPDDRLAMRAFIESQATAPRAHRYRIIRPDGALRWIATRTFPVRGPDGAVVRVAGISRDVSDEVEAQRALARSQRRFDALTEQSGVGIWELDLEGRTSFINPAMCAMIEVDSAAEVTGRTYHEFFTRESVDAMRDEHARRHTGISSSYKAEIVGRRGGRRQAIVYGAAMHGPDGQVEGIIATFSDVTAIGQLEHALGQSQKMEAIGQLAAGVAHDFNNLLVPILGYSEMLIAEGATSATEELRAIRAAALHAKELTTQLLIFARKRTLEMRPLALAEEVRGFATMLSRMLREDIALDVRAPDGAPAIRADVTQVRQILLNLAANAQDAMPRGGTLHVSVQQVVVTEESPRDGDAVEPGVYVELRVEDTGTGMDEATRLRVFEPFFTTKPAGSGTGLGLAMVYGCVRMHGGHIRCESQLGQGTAFVMRFPAAPAGAVAAPDVGAASRTKERAVILVAEDQKPVRMLVRRVLESEGHQVIVAEDGVDALARAAEHPGTIDLLVSDVIMPNMGGYELLEALRVKRANIKALFLSGYPGDDEARLLSRGARFLPKPFQVDVLKQVVREALGEPPREVVR